MGHTRTTWLGLLLVPTLPACVGEIVNAPGGPELGLEGDLGCSEISQVQVRMTFINRYPDRPVALHWVGYDCQEVSTSELWPATAVDQVTFAGHIWRLRDVATQELLLEVRAAGPGPETVIVPREAGGKCSPRTDLEGTVTFENLFTQRALLVSWLDYACNELYVAEIPPRATLAQPTFVDHVWRVRDRTTRELLAEVAAAASEQTIPIPLAPQGNCSPESDTAATITFTNTFGDRTLSAFWVDFGCDEIFYADIGPQQSLVEDTWVGHVWRVRDADSGELISEVWPTSASPIAIQLP